MLEGSHVALDLQHDVARQGSEYFESKRAKSVSYVVLEGGDVAMGVQHDVVGQESE